MFPFLSSVLLLYPGHKGLSSCWYHNAVGEDEVDATFTLQETGAESKPHVIRTYLQLCSIDDVIHT